MPSAHALSRMSDRALDNIVHNAHSIPINGLSFNEADADSTYSTSVDIGDFLGLLIDARGVTGALEALGSDGDAFRMVWDHLDNTYVQNPPAANANFVELGIAYGTYLLNGGEALMDTVKFTADGGDADLLPERSQSMHDNILGNLSEFALVQRFDDDQTADYITEIFDAGLGAIIGEVGDLNDGRKYYEGTDNDILQPTRDFDIALFGSEAFA